MARLKNWVLQPFGGLGNRLRTMACARSAAREYGAKLTVIWTVDADVAAFFEELFQPIPGVKIISKTGRFYGPAWWRMKRERLLAGRFINEFELIEHGVDLSGAHWKAMLPRVNWLVVRTCQAIHAHPDYSGIVLTDSLQQQAQSYFPLNQPTLGLHVRRMHNPRAAAASPVALFFAAGEQFLNQHQNNRVLLCSDEADVMQQARTAWGERVIIPPSEQLNRYTLKGMQEAAITMHLLAQCDRVLGSHYSTFGAVAAAWGGKPFQSLSQHGNS
jgi:hypothetical protein